MGNSGSTNSSPTSSVANRNESFSSASPRRSTGTAYVLNSSTFGSIDGIATNTDRMLRRQRANRSQSLEQSHCKSVVNPSPSSSQSSSNSYLNMITEKGCLRQSTQPKFEISGDLNPHQASLVKRTWKHVLKQVEDDEMEMATQLLLRIFALDHRNQVLFGLGDVQPVDLRTHPLFVKHVKTIEPTLSTVMAHPTNATNLSKYLQQLGGRHVHHTGVTYKCPYWKTFVQALIDIVNVTAGETYDAFFVLGSFCVEQMRIGYKIEFMLQREAERIATAQQKKKRNLLNGASASPAKRVS